MGLHRDPLYLSKRTTFAAEMRRRLWNTVLEINLQSSIISGGPPFLSLSDFDTRPPGNFDNEQLIAEDPVGKPETEFTQMSIAIALRKTFPSRLAIVKLLNDLGPRGTYEETLRLDRELRASCKVLRQTIQGYNSGARSLPSQFEIRVVDILMNHYLLSLHIPFLGRAMRETAFAFSRKVVLEASLKIWYATQPSSSIMAPHPDAIVSSERQDLARFTVCGSGYFRTVAFQASLMIVVELKTQLQEEESMGPVPLQPDLFSALDDAKTSSLQSIKAGETNIKPYLLMSIVVAQIRGLMERLGKEELSVLLLQSAGEAEERCLSILKEKAAQGTMNGQNQTSSMLREMNEGLDFMTSDTLFNFSDVDPMSWLFNNGASQELSLW